MSHQSAGHSIASSAAAKVEMHLRVPVHKSPGASLIEKPLAPLEVAAKERIARYDEYMRLAGEHDARQKEALHALSSAGQPVMTIAVDDLWGIGGEFLRWEIAVAGAGAVLGIDPFDQPNVQESKDNTRRLLTAFVTLRLRRTDGELRAVYEA